MQNRVGSVIPSEQDIEKLIKEVEGLTAKIAKFTISLSSDERQHTLKMRVRGEPIVALVGDLATRHQVALPRISVEDMRDDLSLVQRLQPLARTLDHLSQKIADTILQAQSECWWAATAFYSSLARMSDADPDLERALKPAVEFFARPRQRTESPIRA